MRDVEFNEDGSMKSLPQPQKKKKKAKDDDDDDDFSNDNGDDDEEDRKKPKRTLNLSQDGKASSPRPPRKNNISKGFFEPVYPRLFLSSFHCFLSSSS